MSEWKGKKVLVTGADGFIGSHLSEALIKEGADLTTLSLYNSFDSHGWLDEIEPRVANEIRMVRGDIRDAHQMIQLTKHQEVIFHLAALIAIPFSYDAPTSYIQTNIQGTTNVLLGALHGGCSRVVHTSTSEVYGSALFTPITEQHPLQGQSPYSASKIGADMVAQSFYQSFDLPIVTLRPFNTYGPRQSERAVISTTIRQVLDDRCEAIELGDISTLRDFTFIYDMVCAFMQVAILSDNYIGHTFNAGSGKMFSIQEMVDTILAVTGSDKPIRVNNIRLRPPRSEVRALLADASQFCDASGWLPKVDLETGLNETTVWWRERLTSVRRATSFVS